MRRKSLLGIILLVAAFGNQLSKAHARWLTEHGHDAVPVLDRGQGQTDDRQIWAEAIAEG